MKIIKIIDIVSIIQLFIILAVILYVIIPIWEEYINKHTPQHMDVSAFKSDTTEIKFSQLIVAGIPLYELSVRENETDDYGNQLKSKFYVPMVDTAWQVTDDIYCLLKYNVKINNGKNYESDSLEFLNISFSKLFKSESQVEHVSGTYNRFEIFKVTHTTRKFFSDSLQLNLAGWFDLKKITVNKRKSLSGLIFVTALGI